MAETEKKASKKSWFKGLKAEFRKIIWVDNKRWASRPLQS